MATWLLEGRRRFQFATFTIALRHAGGTSKEPNAEEKKDRGEELREKIEREIAAEEETNNTEESQNRAPQRPTGNKKKAKEKMAKTTNEIITEKAIKKLGSAPRELKTEPANEATKGEEIQCKVPCAEYHYKRRQGRPKLSRAAETAKQTRDKEKLRRNPPNTHIPTNFN